jgi:hypothetical protein
VNTADWNDTPDSGIYAFIESPRFLGGYQSLYDCFTFTVETHMLKPFPQRVQSTIRLLTAFIEISNDKSKQILECRKQALAAKPTFDATHGFKFYYYNWKPDTTKFDKIMFKGYTAEYKDSKVTNGKRLFYNHDKPYKKELRNYKYAVPSDSMRIPNYFVIPQAWSEIVTKLELNGVRCMQSTEDSSATATSLVIDNYETMNHAYEGHYLHHEVTCKSEIQKINIHKGDYLISTSQINYRYCLEVLLPDAVDSYFCWGFFDSILMQKEGFSDYVFEDVADSILTNDPKLKAEFSKWQSENPKADETEQLDYIYKRSNYFEKNYKRYPISLLY